MIGALALTAVAVLAACGVLLVFISWFTDADSWVLRRLGNEPFAKIGAVLFLVGFWPLSVAGETMPSWGYWLLGALACFHYGSRFILEEEHHETRRRLAFLERGPSQIEE